MKKILFSSMVIAAVFSGCGGDSSCCDADLSKNQTLGNKMPPVAKITGLENNTKISVGQSVTANGASSSDRDGTVTAYSWSVDGSPTSTVPNPTFTFDTSGSHEVCLTVTDNDNLKSANIECRTVIVEAPTNAATPVAPTAVITLTDSAAPLAAESEHIFSCAESHDNDTLGTGAEIVACEWEIQSYKIVDGVEVPYRNCTDDAMSGKPIYVCPSAVRIVAKLTVTDNDGQKASTTKEYFTQLGQ